MIAASITLTRPGFTLDARFQTTARVTGLFGPSGCGKTTLIHALAGLARPDGGSIAVGARTLFDAAGGVDVPAHQRSIGVVFQEHRLFPHLSVEANLLYGCRGDRSGLPGVIEMLELAPYLHRRPRDLSGGERQRVALGRALLSRPAALLLDEPLSSLDAPLKQRVIPFLKRVIDSAAMPVLYVSHDLTEIMQLADRVILMNAGAVVGQGPIRELVHDARSRTLVRGAGMENVLRLRVESHRADDGVSVLRAPGTPGPAILAPICPTPVGGEATIAIAASDIALATHELADTSIQNQLHGTVARTSTDGQNVLVELDIGVPLIAEISRGAAKRLEVEPGRRLVCLVKSQAVRVL